MLLSASALPISYVSTAVVGVVAPIFFYLLGKTIYNLFLHPLRKFPGPKPFAASRIPYVLSTLKGRYAHTVEDLHKQYGEVVRIAPDELAFCSPDALKGIYTRQGPNNHPPLPKSRIAYTTPVNGVDSILTVIDHNDHARYRRNLSHAFSDKALQDQAPSIKSYVDLLISKLRENCEGGPQDMVKWFNFIAFDIIGDLTLGESFNCLQQSEYHPWVSFLTNNFKVAAFMTSAARFPGLSIILKKLIPKSLTQARIQHAKFTREKVEKRMRMGIDRPDFMSNVLKNNEKGFGMTRDEIISTFNIVLLAGSETTATLLSAVTFYLLSNPRVMKKLINEIQSSFSTEDEINQVSVNRLTYQIAVLDEALRIHPPTPMGPPRVVTGKGEKIGTYWVPGGTTVSVATWSSTHQEANWKDPYSFVPERWLGDLKYENDKRDVFVPFSLGPRNCIGRNLAYAEMRLILARLLWNFDLELDERSKSWAHNMKSFILWEKPPLLVKLTPVVRKT